MEDILRWTKEIQKEICLSLKQKVETMWGVISCLPAGWRNCSRMSICLEKKLQSHQRLRRICLKTFDRINQLPPGPRPLISDQLHPKVVGSMWLLHPMPRLSSHPGHWESSPIHIFPLPILKHKDKSKKTNSVMTKAKGALRRSTKFRTLLLVTGVPIRLQYFQAIKLRKRLWFGSVPYS